MPTDCSGDCNQALMELGAMVCVPNGAPDCVHCPLADLCEAQKTHRQLDFPVKKPKKARPIERRVVYIICKRPKQGLLANLWEISSCAGGRGRTAGVWRCLDSAKAAQAGETRVHPLGMAYDRRAGADDRRRYVYLGDAATVRTRDCTSQRISCLPHDCAGDINKTQREEIRQ